MLPKIAVVCGADTELGKFVVRELLRSSQILHIYALAERDLLDNLPHSPHHLRKLTLILQPLDMLERTIANSVPEADLAFCCLGSPRYLYATQGHYLYHKLNLDIPLRFLYETSRLAAHSVSFISHPSASSRSRSHFLRVKGQLLDAVRSVHTDLSPHAPRVTFLMIPYMLNDSTTDPSRLPASQKVSALERIKQRAAIKHDVPPNRAVHVRDAAKAMVADALNNLLADAGDQLHPLAAQLAIPTQRFLQLDAPAIVELANSTRTAQRERMSRRRDRTAMQEKASDFSRAARDHPPDDLPDTTNTHTHALMHTPSPQDEEQPDEAFEQPDYDDDDPQNDYQQHQYAPQQPHHHHQSQPPQPPHPHQHHSRYRRSTPAPSCALSPPLPDTPPVAPEPPPPPPPPRPSRHHHHQHHHHSHHGHHGNHGHHGHHASRSGARDRDDSPPADQPPARRPTRHSVDAMARQLARPLTRVRGNTYLPDVGDNDAEAAVSSGLPRSRSYHSGTTRSGNGAPPSTRPPGLSDGRGGDPSMARPARSFHGATQPRHQNSHHSDAQPRHQNSRHSDARQSDPRNSYHDMNKTSSRSRRLSTAAPPPSSQWDSSDRTERGSRRAAPGLVAQISALAMRVISATDRPAARRASGQSERSRRRSAPRASGDLRAVGQTTI